MITEEYAPPMVSRNDFMTLVNDATSRDKYAFLTINNKVPTEIRFRQNLSDVISLPMKRDGQLVGGGDGRGRGRGRGRGDGGRDINARTKLRNNWTITPFTNSGPPTGGGGGGPGGPPVGGGGGGRGTPVRGGVVGQPGRNNAGGGRGGQYATPPNQKKNAGNGKSQTNLFKNNPK